VKTFANLCGKKLETGSPKREEIDQLFVVAGIQFLFSVSIAIASASV